MTGVWAKLKYFRREENWGDPDRMHPEFLMMLDDWRASVGHPFRLTTPAFTTTGHAIGSYHYLGRAADGRLIDAATGKPLSLGHHILAALRSPFGGIGIYTWSKNGPFLHLDDREIYGQRKIWVCEKEGVYKNLTPDLLHKLLSTILIQS